MASLEEGDPEPIWVQIKEPVFRLSVAEGEENEPEEHFAGEAEEEARGRQSPGWQRRAAADDPGVAAETAGSGWGTSTGAGFRSTGGGRRRFSPGRMSFTQSAPMLPATSGQASFHGTWYSTSSSWRTSGGLRHTVASWSDASGNRMRRSERQWQPLGSTWRDREHDDRGDPVRTNVDNARPYATGAMPNWRQGAVIRSLGALEHGLVWAYYRTRRNESHPLFQQVNKDMTMGHSVSAMRGHQDDFLSFWRDLRPPFHVSEAHRVDDVTTSEQAGGDFYDVTYTCGLAYSTERCWGEGEVGNTFDNKCQGVARVHIPGSFPRKGHLQVLSWGSPKLSHQRGEQMPQRQQEQDETQGPQRSLPPLEPCKPRKSIDPKQWMPIAEELGLRAHHPRLAGCREAVRRASVRMSTSNYENHDVTEVAPMRRALMGRHASLPALAQVALDQDGEGHRPPRPRKQRQHRIFTRAAGFVRYAG